MKGIDITVAKDKKTATVTIDLTNDFGPSASGKTVIVGTTGGNVELGETGVFVGVNAYKYPTPKASK
jgi:hypothetical protein